VVQAVVSDEIVEVGTLQRAIARGEVRVGAGVTPRNSAKSCEVPVGAAVGVKKPRNGLNPDPTRTHPPVRLAVSAVGPGSGP
jgi:hypothetical protein